MMTWRSLTGIVLVLLLDSTALAAYSVAKLKSGALFARRPLSDVSMNGESYMLNEAVKTHEREFSRSRESPFTFEYDSRSLFFNDSFQVGQTFCDQMKVGVTSVFSIAPDRSAENMLRSFSDRFQLPYLSGSHVMAGAERGAGLARPFRWSVNIRPFFTRAILALREKLGWEKITYITDTDSGTAAVKELLSSDSIADFEVIIRKVETDIVTSHENTLKQLKAMDETRIMIDATVRGTFTFFKAAYDLQMLLPTYQYIVLNPAARDYDALKLFTRGGMNITALSISEVNSRQKLKFASRIQNASEPLLNGTYVELPMLLAYDSIAVLREAWRLTNKEQALTDLSPTDFQHSCDRDKIRTYRANKTLSTFMEKLLGMRISGVTGNIQFDSNGYRKNLSLQLHEISYQEDDKEIGSWSEEMENFIIKQNSSGLSSTEGEVKRELIITSIEEKPFLMMKEPEPGAKPLEGNDRFEGYCVDLLDMLANELKFKYTIRLVPDGQYGAENEDGTWNGMIGEVISKRADLAVAPLTINADRQRVVAFTKPFMNIGISIMIKRPQSELPGPMSFLDPFSEDIWYGILIAYCGVSLGLFLVARFSPTEWQDKVSYDDMRVPTAAAAGGGEPVYKKHNDFTINNSMWFSLGALMQQGTDIAPKAAASRIVGGVWWFFTLIIISSYTANLAAFLTVERMQAPFNNADELAKQTKIRYGTRSSGSTKQFFNNSQIEVFEKMWDFMSTAQPSVFVKTNEEGIERVRRENGKYAFLIESAMNEYVAQQKPCDTMKIGPNLDSKGYGIAAAPHSPWVKNITLVILKFQEDGELERLKTTWWVDKGECGGSFSSTSTDSTNSLGLSSVAGIFYILISGLGLAMLSAIAEYFLKTWKRNKHAHALVHATQQRFMEPMISSDHFTKEMFQEGLSINGDGRILSSNLFQPINISTSSLAQRGGGGGYQPANQAMPLDSYNTVYSQYLVNPSHNNPQVAPIVLEGGARTPAFYNGVSNVTHRKSNHTDV